MISFKKKECFHILITILKVFYMKKFLVFVFIIIVIYALYFLFFFEKENAFKPSPENETENTDPLSKLSSEKTFEMMIKKKTQLSPSVHLDQLSNAF